MKSEKQIKQGIDAAIEEAIQRGEFDNLKGKGKPLNLDAYFDTPEEIRLGYSVLKNAGYVPEEVQLLNEIAELKTQMASCKDEKALEKLKKSARDKQLKYDLLMDLLKKHR